MILEGLMTTVNADGSVNLAPMGPIVGPEMRELLFRPYQTSATYANLKRTGQGVFHVTDDVEILARAAIGAMEEMPRLAPAVAVNGWIVLDACRWYACRVRSIDDSRPRTEIVCDVVDRGTQREFFGFNRAKHAVLEAAILATRVDLLPREELLADLTRLAVPVQKTGGQAERSAFALLEDYVCRRQHVDEQIDFTS